MTSKAAKAVLAIVLASYSAQKGLLTYPNENPLAASNELT